MINFFKKKYKNIFICCTPLQMYIAIKIIEINKLKKKDNYVFVYTCNDNSIYKNYYKKLLEKCTDGTYYVWKNNFPIYFIDWLIFIKTKRFENIYLASIDSYFCQLIVSNNIKSLVYTFDDGTANIIKNSTYYITEKFSTKQFFYFIAGNRFSKLSIREKSLKHFTIYKNIENISKNKENLSLFNDFDLHSDSILKNNCIVILGTAYHEIAIDIKDCKKIKGRLTKYVKNNNINAEPVFYVPHPRELIENNDILWTVNINVLVEEYIIYLLTRFCNIKLIGFGSTAQINLCEIDRIQNIYLQSCLCKQINNSIHEIEFEIKKLKPNIVNID